jgi:polar amino acid transport system permease protein
MAESSTAVPDFRTPRQILDPRVLTRNIIERRSWFFGFLLLDAFIIYYIWFGSNSAIMTEAWNVIWPGIATTVVITVEAFILATIVGMIIALLRLSKNIFIYNAATLYVELFRGLPLLVIILIFAFALKPAFVNFAASIPALDDITQRLVGIDPGLISTTTIGTRNISDTTMLVLAFSLTYAAFMSEVFRAGIESIGKGQTEAARSLGMSYVQAMRYIILPQAIKNVLPAMANNFILLLKDTSLASVLAVPEISYLTRQYSSNRFRYPEGLLCLSFIYANLTILMSLGVYWLESRLQADRKEE